MREIPVLLISMCMIAVALPQDNANAPTLESKQTLDDLINQIFTPDNSGVATPTPNTISEFPPTSNPPVIVPGGNGDGHAGIPEIKPYQPTEPPYQPQPNPPPSNPPPYQPSGQPSGPSPCDFGECIPYYQCSNGTIITDGEGLLDIRFGQEENIDSQKHPCPGLFNTCCSLISDTKQVTPNTVVNHGCGIRNMDGVGFRITGDKDNESQFGEFPWTVALLKEEKALDGQTLNVYVCGGSIISPDVILTAAHCVDGKDPKSLKIRAGEWDTQTKDEIFPHQDRDVGHFVVHPGYYRGGLFNDIALLFLKQPVQIAENVNTVCLPNHGDIFDHARCFASGWGKDLFGKEDRS